MYNVNLQAAQAIFGEQVTREDSRSGTLTQETPGGQTSARGHLGRMIRAGVSQKKLPIGAR
jgi:hypothetical protein